MGVLHVESAGSMLPLLELPLEVMYSFIRCRAFMATECNEVFSGDKPCY
jgi:hypothetical protein